MKVFHRKVDLRSRKEMIGFLENHFRYDTMNSWNRSTSYANNLKVDRIGLSNEQVMKLLDIMDCDGAYDNVNDRIWEFGCNHDWKWQAGFNGRSGGYLVLYQGGWRPDEHKSYCTACGQMNFTAVEETGCRCGRCGKDTRVNFAVPRKQIYTTGKGLDMDEDFEDWTMDELRERVRLVEEFDILCDEIVAEAAWLADHMEAEEQEIMVPATRRVLKEAVGC